jgi:hypothetical protein
VPGRQSHEKAVRRRARAAFFLYGAEARGSRSRGLTTQVQRLVPVERVVAVVVSGTLVGLAPGQHEISEAAIDLAEAHCGRRSLDRRDLQARSWRSCSYPAIQQQLARR